MSLLSTYINNFKHIKSLVIGDVMLDKFMYGKVERISPEAPVPIFKFSHEKEMLGGAGNVVANLVALGCKTTFIGIIGDDENGAKISDLMEQTGASSHFLKLKNFPTIVKTRLIAGNNHLLRADQEEILPVISELLPKFKKVLRQAIKMADIVLVSDYNKGLLTPVTTQMIVEICREQNKKIIIDPKGSDYSKYAGATLVKPNLKEFSEATGRKYNPQAADFLAQAKQGAEFLFAKYGIKNLIITLSEYGMLHIGADDADDIQQVPTEAKEVFDVSGAGDTALATLGAALGCDTPIKDALKLANTASGIVVGKLGTATVSAEEMRNALSCRETADNNWPQKRKVVTLEQAEKIVAELRKQNKIIGFTNGCFDCCHLGHLHSFIEAKKHCDVLFVAMNSDACVERHKGENRPIQDEKTRALLLASLEFVDYVIVFNDDVPMNIVKALRPDVIAKEGYPIEKWPEAQFVLSYGGKPIVLQRLEGYSTSNLAAKMKG